MASMTRRLWMLGAAGAALVQGARPPGVLVDTHIHLFARDTTRFPIHPNSPYQPQPQPLEDYAEFVREVKIDHAVIVHPEPYQDDHRYLEYCFEHEPWPGFFKGTCLFDPIAPDTPARMRALVRKHSGRIIALRIHETEDPKRGPTTSGAIRDRDMKSPQMLAVWKKAHSLGLAIQMHLIPYYAPHLRALASQLRQMPVLLDHLARAGQGSAAEYEEVLRLSELPRVYMKFSGVSYSSKAGYPYRDVQPLVKRVFQAFGADRILWGGLGMSRQEFERQTAMFEEMFAFATEADRAKIRGLNAMKLFGFQS
ncbi:MAG: amidohydrolase family protein [Bryobacteraceae bacterium]